MNNNNNNNNNGDRSQSGSWYTAGAVGLGIAAAVGAYFLRGNSKQEEKEYEEHKPEPKKKDATCMRTLVSPPAHQEPPPRNPDNNVSSYLFDMVSRLALQSSDSDPSPESSSAPDNPVINNLNSLLDDIYVRYIKLKDFPLHYKVFDVVFNDLHKKMKEVDLYYRKYSSTVQFAGSHFDNLRIHKPDEFDMDIVIGLPLNIKLDPFKPSESDINIEAKAPGFVQLKMGVQFQRLHMRDYSEWENNKAAFEWMDSCNYLLRSKFSEWFEGVVNRALNQYAVRSQSRPVVYVEGIAYIIEVSKSGPAMTLKIRNYERNFKMDVDLVPALKFPESRWPISKYYRDIPAKCKKGYWMVVPKPNKESPISQDQMRSWRIALHNQERELMHDSNNLKPTIKLIKKLRDSLNMDKIASYYIKTIFFHEILAINNVEHWRNGRAVLFKQMVGKLHEALVEGKIPYFWHKGNNLIGSIPSSTLNQYANKLVLLMKILDDPSQYKLVAKYLLTSREFNEYNSKFLHI